MVTPRPHYMICDDAGRMMFHSDSLRRVYERFLWYAPRGYACIWRKTGRVYRSLMES